MLRIVLDVAAPVYAIPGVKETLAMYVEEFGDARVVSVTEIPERYTQGTIWLDREGKPIEKRQRKRGCP